MRNKDIIKIIPDLIIFIYKITYLKKDRKYIINLDEYGYPGPHWIAWYVDGNRVIYFDSFRVEHIPEGIRKFRCDKNMTTNMFRV